MHSDFITSSIRMGTMTVKAKTLIKDKFWIVEQNGEKLGTLQKKDNNGWIFLSKADKRQVYHTQESLFQRFGVGIFSHDIKIGEPGDSTVETIEGDEYFEVESIVDQRFNKRTKSFEFRVKFLGYEESDNRWIPERELADTCTDLLREYKELLKQAEEMNESEFETEVVDE